MSLPKDHVYKLRDRLKNQQLSWLINIDHPSASLVESVSKTGIEAIMFDTEQGSPDIESIENMARAARLHKVCSIVRAPNSEPWAIERLMQRGIDGLVIPRAEDINTVNNIVNSFEYCIPNQRDDFILIVQLEHINLMSNLQELAAISGIDCVFIGPVDLSKSMGFKGDYNAVPVRGQIITAIKELHKAGMPVAMMVKPHDIKEWADLGVELLYAHTNDFIDLGAKELIDRAQLSDTAGK